MTATDHSSSVAPEARVGWLAAFSRPYLLAPSVIVLIAANLIPLAGVMFWGWDLYGLMLLYWLETGIIGFWTILHMAILARWGALFLVPFFTVHFGGFMAGHLLFIWVMFGGGDGAQVDSLENLKSIFRVEPGFWIAALALFLSHTVSFAVNVWRPLMAERRGAPQPHGPRTRADDRAQNVMMAPYGRVVVMHVTILIGALLSEVFKTRLAAFVLLIALKIVVDVAAHVRKNFRPVQN